MWRPCPELSAEELARKWRPVARGVAGRRPGSQLMEAALGLRGRCVTWHHPRWGEEPPGLRLAGTRRERGTHKVAALNARSLAASSEVAAVR